MDHLLELIARIGGDNPPTRTELEAARTELAGVIHAESTADDLELADLEAMTAAYATLDSAVQAAEAADAERQERIAELTASIPAVNQTAATETAETETEADQDDDEDEEEQETAVSSESVAASLSQAAARFAARRTSRDTETAQDAATQPTLSVRVANRDIEPGSFSFADLGQAARDAMRSPSPGKNVLYSSRVEYPANWTLPGNPDGNTTVMRNAITHGTSVAAAGGCCSLATPIRDQPRQASSTARPVRDNLVTVAAPNGAVELFPAVCIPDGGVALWTCADDAAVTTGVATWKDCETIECPTSARFNVDAIYRCFTVGNYQARFAPSQYAAVLEKAMALQARTAEVQLITAMVAASQTTAHTVTATGDAVSTLLQSIWTAAATIRQDQRYGNARLNVFLAEWWKDALRTSMIAHQSENGMFDPLDDAAITRAFNASNLNPVWSPDMDLIHAQNGQADGALDLYPQDATVIVAHPADFGFLDGGELDLGIEVRDHDLNRQNSVAAFAESYEGLVPMGCNSKSITIPAEICQNVPCPV